jgi:hypothetical protein
VPYLSCSKVAAIMKINELRENMVMLVISGHVAVQQHSSDHFAVADMRFHGIRHLLDEQERPVAVVAAKALDEILKDTFMDNATHQQFFESFGLGEEFKDTMITIQDAIGMNMVLHPETHTQVMEDMHDLDLNTRSKLRHSYIIQKRFLRHVGQHILRIGAESTVG